MEWMAENSPSPAGAAHAWDQARLWRSLALLAPPANRQDTSTLMQSIVSCDECLQQKICELPNPHDSLPVKLARSTSSAYAGDARACTNLITNGPGERAECIVGSSTSTGLENSSGVNLK
jgi:hypothetical protein